MDVSPVHPRNAVFPIESNVDGNCMAVRLEHSINAESAIVLTLSGKEQSPLQLRGHIKSRADDQSQCHLSDDLHPAVQSLLVMLESLDVVICKSQCAKD